MTAKRERCPREQQRQIGRLELHSKITHVIKPATRSGKQAAWQPEAFHIAYMILCIYVRTYTYIYIYMYVCR